MPGNNPGASGSGRKNAYHCAMLTPTTIGILINRYQSRLILVLNQLEHPKFRFRRNYSRAKILHLTKQLPSVEGLEGISEIENEGRLLLLLLLLL